MPMVLGKKKQEAYCSISTGLDQDNLEAKEILRSCLYIPMLFL